MADLTSRNVPMLPVRARARVDLLGEGRVAFLLGLAVLTCLLMPEPRAWGADLGDDRLVTAGLGIRIADMSSFLLRTYDAHSGELISEDEFELTVDEESAAEVEAGGGRVYAVGSGLGQGGLLTLVVRAYDARTGDLLWEDDLNPSLDAKPTLTSFQTTGTQTLQPEHSGSQIRPVFQSSFIVRSLNSRTGEVIWEDEFHAHHEAPDPSRPRSSLGDEELVDHHFSIQIRTFDTATGEFLWEDQFYPEQMDTEASDEEAESDWFGPAEEPSTSYRL